MKKLTTVTVGLPTGLVAGGCSFYRIGKHETALRAKPVIESEDQYLPDPRAGMGRAGRGRHAASL